MAAADLDGELIGFIAAVVDPVAYWKVFPWRHPIIWATAVIHKLLRGGRRTGIDHWNHSSPSIARILYVGVAERFRRHGIGVQLYRTVIHMLSKSGVQRVETHIDPAISRVCGYTLG